MASPLPTYTKITACSEDFCEINVYHVEKFIADFQENMETVFYYTKVCMNG
jgi:hypothetical protein